MDTVYTFYSSLFLLQTTPHHILLQNALLKTSSHKSVPYHNKNQREKKRNCIPRKETQTKLQHSTSIIVSVLNILKKR